jgi:hypothetical protein
MNTRARRVGWNKYGAKRTLYQGIWFDSKQESIDYQKLKLWEAAGEISNLRLQVPYDLAVNGIHITRYEADFVYWDEVLGREVVADSKGVQTGEFKIKKQLMLAVYGIEILLMSVRKKKARKKKAVKDGAR